MPFRNVMLRVPSDAFNSLNGNIACFNTTTREMVKSFLAPVLSYGRVRLARFARVRLLRHALPISLLILRTKTTVLQSIFSCVFRICSGAILILSILAVLMTVDHARNQLRWGNYKIRCKCGKSRFARYNWVWECTRHKNAPTRVCTATGVTSTAQRFLQHLLKTDEDQQNAVHTLGSMTK